MRMALLESQNVASRCSRMGKTQTRASVAVPEGTNHCMKNHIKRQYRNNTEMKLTGDKIELLCFVR